MAITPQAGYKIDPTNPNAVIKDTGSAMPGSVASFSQPSITSKNTVTQPQINLTPKPDNNNYLGILAGAQQQALALQQQIAQQTQPQPEKKPEQAQGDINKSYIDSIMGVQQPNAIQTYQQGYDQSGLAQQKADLQAKAQVTTEAQGRLNNISAQLQALNTEATAVPIALQQDSIGRGRTESGIAPLQADELRKIALRALPLQSEGLIVQAQVANAQNQQQLAQDLYKQAESKFNQLFQLQMEDSQRKYEFQTNLIEKIYSFADAQEKRQLESLKTQQEQDFKAQQDTIDYQRQVNLIKLRQQSTPTTTTTPQQLSTLKLSTTQKSDLVDIQTLEDQLNKLQGYAADGRLEGVGSFGAGSIKSTAFSLFGTGSKEGADVRTLIGNLKGQIAKLRGGTSFTVNEEKLLNSYVPGINESTASILAKVRGLQEFLASKKNAIIQVGGGIPATNGNDPLGIL